MSKWGEKQQEAFEAVSDTIQEMMKEWDCSFEYARASLFNHLNIVIDIEEELSKEKEVILVE